MKLQSNRKGHPTPTARDKFYAVCLKPYHNGNTRWSVYFQANGGDNPNPNPDHITTSGHCNTLVRLWPVDCQNPKQSRKNGWSYSSRTNYPAYHIHINEVGTDHHTLLKQRILFILTKEYGETATNFNDITLEVLS